MGNDNKINKLETTINNLRNQIFQEQNKNNNLIQINTNLINQINELKNKLFQEQNNTINLNNIINNLKYQLNNNQNFINNIQNNNQNNNTIELYKRIEELNKRIDELNKKIKRYPINLEENEKLMSVIFTSVDQKAHYSIICKNTDTINRLEEELYKEYPEYCLTENYFLCNGQVINKFKTFEVNHIKNGDIIVLNKRD